MLGRRALSIAMILSLCLSIASAQKKATTLAAPTFYIAAAEFSGADQIYVRGASNLPAGTHFIINIYEFVGQGSSVLNQDTRVTIGKDGFFGANTSPKSEVEFHPNLVCEVIFMPTFPVQERSVLRVVGTHGEKLNSSRSVSENSSLLLLNSLEKECKCVRIIWNHGETIPNLPSRTRFAFTSEPARMVAG